MDTLQVHEHLGLVKSIAGRVATRVPSSVSVDELIGAGVEGLADAAQRYRPEKGVPFPAYASLRVKGAMLDFVRHQDWSPRSVRSRSRRLRDGEAALEQRLGRSPRDEELAEFLDIPLQEVREDQTQALAARTLSLDGVPGLGLDEDGGMPCVARVEPEAESHMEREELLEFLCKALEALPHREYLVLALYYWEGLVMREIGQVLGVSEAAVSSHHADTIRKVRKSLLWHYRVDALRYGE